MPPISRRYRLLGQLYLWTYTATVRRWLGVSWRSWLLLPGAVLAFFIADGGSRLAGLITALLLVLLPALVFWRAARAGYHAFLPSGPERPPAQVLPLPPNQRETARATGVFSLADRERFVLLRRPMTYWRVPLGDHVVMVEATPGRFLYQFFSAGTLLGVQPGWLIFGAVPQRTLAVSFYVTFGPDLDNPTRAYFVGASEDRPPTRRRTVYFSFESEEAFNRVWQTLVTMQG